MEKRWWKEAVIYQVYPRSFKDSNGDGIGDLNGIIEKIDYLQLLGVDVIWLNPCYKSPNDDNGYDISDYYSIMDDFGTLVDFDRLLAEAHARNIKVIMDLVVNHTSDEHPWFLESRSSKDNPKRDYYIWRPGKAGKEPNNWASFFTPSAWQFDKISGEYYLHLFSVKQPDLNWESEKMRNEIFAMMQWWCERGIDGFRLDAINAIKKRSGLPDSHKKDKTPHGYVFDPDMILNNEGVADFLKEMNDRIFTPYDIMTVGETSYVTPEMALELVDENKNIVNMLIHFEVVDSKEELTLPLLKQINHKWYSVLHGRGWQSQYLSNHDQPRQVSVYGNDTAYRVESAKLLATMIHTLPGTPFIYQGEELGMTNLYFSSIDEFDDISSRHQYEQMLKKGQTEQEALLWLHRFSRENSRTPMQWDGSDHAGFTKGKPWLRVNPNYCEVNAERALADGESIFHYYRKLIALRRREKAIVYGDYRDLLPEDEKLYVYERSLDGRLIRVLLNFSDETTALEKSLTSGFSLEFGNYSQIDTAVGSMRPWESLILIR